VLQSLPSQEQHPLRFTDGSSTKAVQVPSAPHVPLQHSASSLHPSPPAMQVHTRRKLKLHPVPRVHLSDISRGVQRRALFASQVLTAPSKSVSTHVLVTLPMRSSGILLILDCPQGPLELLYVACESFLHLNGQPPEPPCDSSLQQRTACTAVFSTVFSFSEHLLLRPHTRVRCVVASRGADVVGFSVGMYVGCILVGKSVSGVTTLGLLEG